MLAALADRHGEGWTSMLLAEWNSRPRWHFAPGLRPAWIADLPALCGALRDADGAPAARLVLAVSRDELAESLAQARDISRPSRRAQALDQLAAPTAGLLVGAAIGQVPEVTDATLAVLVDSDDALLRYTR